MTTTDAPAPSATEVQISWLIDTYGVTLYRIAFAIVRNRQIAEDVVQEVLVKAWTSMPSWDDDVPIRWARTVTKNTALSAVRYASSRPAEPIETIHQGLPHEPGPEDDYERDEAIKSMWGALDRLDDESRLLLVLHEVDGLSYDEIVSTTGLTLPAVKSKIYRARLALRHEVSR